MDSRYFFFIKSPKISRLGIHLYFGAKPKSYVGRIVDRIYDYHFLGARNLKFEYIQYYRKEFPTYLEFLKRRFNLTSEESKMLNSYLAFYKDLKFNSDSDVPLLLEDENLSTLFKLYCRGAKI